MDRSGGAAHGPLITLLVTPAELRAERVVLEGETYHHLFRSRRAEAGDRVRLADGEGSARWASIESVERRRAVVAVGEAAPTFEPGRRVELLVALPKGARASWLVEKATEVGVAAVRWMASERAPRDLGAAGLERHERVARAALEQCHRSRLPEVSGPHPWSSLPGLLEGAAERFVLDPRADGESGSPPAGDSAAVVVGPEGGWTERESEELAALGCRPVALGRTVLRIETAAILGAFWALR